ncbi:MAG: dihydroorotase, multifunctional complex type [Bacteroidota bacterium]|jgi:dihydroorotase|nr:dihydroorotase, multifunctional complex type [Bacteroidota bacterium]
MNILIKQARIIDQNSPHNGKTMDVLIENGIISAVRPKINTDKNVKVIDVKNLHISAGWFDMQANFCDPGYEHKEDLQSGIRAAAAGGFTGVAVTPSTNPPIHSKAQVQYIKTNTDNAIVEVHPIGTITQNREGKELSEMYDMQLAGAIAFSDDKNAISNSGILLRALLYSKNFDALVMAHCDDKSISQDGQMNEGINSTKLGLKGIPALAEELMISRNIFLSEYTDAPLHISNVSSKGSVELIRDAKAKGLKITSSVNAYNISLDDNLLQGFDSNYKLNPPLRTKNDIDALRKGIADGTIDVITSDHRPQDIESKDLEFDHASNGMIGLESAFALINSNRGKLKLEAIVNSLTTQPRNILKIKPVTIKENEAANITMFDPDMEWVFEKKHIHSKSSNTPFQGTKFKGKVIGVINRKQIALNK